MRITAYHKLEGGNGYFIRLPSQSRNQDPDPTEQSSPSSEAKVRSSDSNTKETMVMDSRSPIHWIEIAGSGRVRNWSFVEVVRDTNVAQVTLYDATRNMFVRLTPQEAQCSSDGGVSYYRLGLGTWVRQADIPDAILDAVQEYAGIDLRKVRRKHDQAFESNGNTSSTSTGQGASSSVEQEPTRRTDTIADKWKHDRGCFFAQRIRGNGEISCWKEKLQDGKTPFSFREISRDIHTGKVVLFDETRNIYVKLKPTSSELADGHDAPWRELYKGSWDTISPTESTDMLSEERHTTPTFVNKIKAYFFVETSPPTFYVMLPSPDRKESSYGNRSVNWVQFDSQGNQLTGFLTETARDKGTCSVILFDPSRVQFIQLTGDGLRLSPDRGATYSHEYCGGWIPAKDVPSLVINAVSSLTGIKPPISTNPK